ncbi:equilibrative nucleoside transporter 4-like [Lineus longissimus]|uniref:equilibrative nucleoside transporter 4-like n=1 Tax=Lineus longissimus TaxID=88925 RepID=UPI00315D002C
MFSSCSCIILATLVSMLSSEDRDSGASTMNQNGDINRAEPKDKYSLAFCASIMCGVSFLIPWTSITMAVDFFQMTYPGTSIMFAISILYVAVIWLGTTLSNMTVELLNPRVKILFGFVLTIACLAYLAIVEAWIRPFSLEVSYHLVLLCCLLLSFGAAIIQCNMYGIFSMLPMRYTMGFMFGESLAGIISVATRIFTKAVIENVKTSTVIFFSSTLFVSVLCLLAFEFAMKSSFVTFHIEKCRVTAEKGECTELLKVDELDLETNTSSEYGSTAQITVQNGDFMSRAAPPTKEPLMIRIKKALDNRVRIVRIIWPYILTFWLNFVITAGAFPGLSSEVISCKLGSWMPVIMLSLFNVFDIIGKVITKWQYDWPGFALVLCGSARFVLIPLFILCAAPRLHPVIDGVALPFILSSVNGITNGYFACVLILLAPTKVSAEQRELVGNTMVFALTTGLSVGSATAYGYEAILGPRTPLNNPCLRHVNST